jgi:hypothetical protein
VVEVGSEELVTGAVVGMEEGREKATVWGSTSWLAAGADAGASIAADKAATGTAEQPATGEAAVAWLRALIEAGAITFS